MSTFSNTHDAPAIPTTPQDDVIIRHFREATPAAIRKLNADLDLRLDEPRFKWLQTYFRDMAKRDPTAGELRLLDTLDRVGQDSPDRVAVGELYTDSTAIAETWADMMSKHHALHGGSASQGKAAHGGSTRPCTISEALTLIGDYLYRTGLALPPTDGGKNAEGRTAVLSAPWQEAQAAAVGYRPVTRILLGNGEIRTVCVRHGRGLTGAPERAGDFLLYLRRADLTKVTALVDGEREKSHPAWGDIRAVVGSSALMTALNMCGAADIYIDRLTEGARTATKAGRISVTALCDLSTSDGVTADFILRVPMKQVHAVSEALHELGLTAIVFGQVRANERTVIHMRNAAGTQDIPVVDLPSALLKQVAAVRLYRYRLAVETPQGNEVYEPLAARRPFVERGESGLTPNGHETVALTAFKGSVLAVPEADLLTHTVTATVTAEGEGYGTALNAVLGAVSALTAVGIDRTAVTLSVSITAGDGNDRPGSMTLEVLCGLYRAAAELGIPVADPTMAVGRTDALSHLTGDSPAVGVTVTAWVRDRAACEKTANTAPVDRLTAPDRHLYLLYAEPSEDGLPAMDETRVLLDYVASLSASDTPPTLLLPLHSDGLTLADRLILAETASVAADICPACQSFLTRRFALAYLVESDTELRGVEIGRTVQRDVQAAVESTAPADDRQWRSIARPVGKESPLFLLPVLRRSYEGSLRTLAAALNRNGGAGCVIRPVVIDTVTVEVPVDEPTATDPLSEAYTGENEAAAPTAPLPPRTETREVLNPDSVRELNEQFFQWKTPIFAMSEADTRLLLNEPTVREALEKQIDMGYPVIALNESCKPLAEWGFLPKALTELTTVSTEAPATVSYDLGAPEAVRLVRGDLLVPMGESAADTPHLLTLRTADGHVIPDGFVGRDGKVLGLLNGVDTTTVPLCVKHSFDTSNPYTRKEIPL